MTEYEIIMIALRVADFIMTLGSFAITFLTFLDKRNSKKK